MSCNKVSNEYAQAINPALYSDIPKAVFAAIAISALTCGGDWITEAEPRLAKEWSALFNAGIVPQPLTPHARVALSQPTTLGN